MRAALSDGRGGPPGGPGVGPRRGPPRRRCRPRRRCGPPGRRSRRAVGSSRSEWHVRLLRSWRPRRPRGTAMIAWIGIRPVGDQLPAGPAGRRRERRRPAVLPHDDAGGAAVLHRSARWATSSSARISAISASNARSSSSSSKSSISNASIVPVVVLLRTSRSRRRMVPASTSDGELGRHLAGEVGSARRGTRPRGSPPGRARRSRHRSFERSTSRDAAGCAPMSTPSPRSSDRGDESRIVCRLVLPAPSRTENRDAS